MTHLGITIAGVGGQGSILAGIVLGSAAVTYDRKYAVQTQAYSSELRGGFAAAWVIISEEPVVFPRVTRPDILIAQSQDSISRFASTLKDDGSLIIDSDLVHQLPEKIKNIYEVRATNLAHNRLKAPLTANMIILGALCKVTGVVRREALHQAISASVPEKQRTVNLEAFALGFDQVKAR